MASWLPAICLAVCFLTAAPSWAARSVSSTVSVQPDTLLFVDADVQDAGQLLRGVGSKVKIVALRGDADGVEQIADTLQHYRNLDSIQIVAHGAPGRLALGSAVLTGADLDRYRVALQAWGGALKPSGGILLYGCNVARGEDGDRFVERLARIAGAPVAASTDATGSPSLDGNWALEKQTSPMLVKRALAEPGVSGYTRLLPLPSNGVQDITGAMADGTPTLVSFPFAFKFINDSHYSYSSDLGPSQDGIFVLDNTPGASTTFTVEVDGINLFRFDLTALSFKPFASNYNYDFTITGYKLGGATVQTTFSSTGLSIGTGNYADFTRIFGFQVTYVSSNGGDQSNITFDSFTIANASATASSTVTFNANGGSGSMAAQTAGSPTNLAANSFARTGYTFAGWNTAANGGGTAYADQASYPFAVDATLFAQWTANAPTATTGSASGIGFNGATLGGTVNDNGLAVTVIVFDYGTTVAYGSTVAATPGTLGAGSGATAVSAGISGLACGTLYHFRVKATSAGGTSNGSDNTFTTTACTVPGAPTIGVASAGDGQASVAFTPPASNGGSAITGYTATSSPGGLTGACAASPCAVTGLTNGTAYTFTVTATNAIGTGPASAASNAVTPKGSQTITFANPGAQNFGTAPTLSATASSGLTVGFTSSTTPVCTITPGGALTFLAPGTCTINADQAGNGAYLAAATVTRSFTVNAVVPGAPTIGVASAGDGQVSVAFTPPASNGGSAITGYTATSSPGGLTGACAASPCAVTGLTNGTAYTFTVTATNAIGTGPASAASNAVTPLAAGACGPADGLAASYAPGGASLCSAGTASGVTSSGGTYTWTCTGGGAPQNCSAPWATTGTGSGQGMATVSGGTWVFTASGTGPMDTAGFIPVSGHPKSPTLAPPASVTFPHGLFDFVLTGGVNGSTAQISITFPSALPANAQYWKFGPTAGDTTAHWYVLPGGQVSYSVDRMTVIITITDGGLGDDDLSANGLIVDQGGPGVPVGGGAGVTAIPTLSQWGLLFLGGLLALSVPFVLRRRLS